MMIVFYDSWCPLCTALARKIKQVDRRQRTVCVSFRDDDVVNQYELSASFIKKMEQRLYVYDSKQKHWYDGIHALCALAARVPLYWGLVPLLQVSIWLGFGERVYDFVAKRRKIVPVGHCQDGVCQLPNNKG
ncbi:thiol-disulfide oxidoreductase DCC family protein [Microbacteriaceae bacterium 4G12]